MLKIVKEKQKKTLQIKMEFFFQFNYWINYRGLKSKRVSHLISVENKYFKINIQGKPATINQTWHASMKVIRQFDEKMCLKRIDVLSEQ